MPACPALAPEWARGGRGGRQAPAKSAERRLCSSGIGQDQCQKRFTCGGGEGRILPATENPFPLPVLLGGFNAFANHNAGALALIAGFAAVVALALGVMAFLRLQAITRPFQWLSGQWDGEPDSLTALLHTVERNTKDIETVRAAVEAITTEGRSHFKRIGLVRYDAFDGIAGQQSYSLCLLDDNRNGFVLSNLVGAKFSRSYAVEIAEGEAPRKLGEEEDRALHLALNRQDL
jgi:hypothetical protein